MLRLILAASLAGLLASAATAQSEPSSSTEPTVDPATVVTAAEDEEYDPLKVVCRKVRPPTGTRVISGQTRQRMCMSNADWEQQELDAQEALRERDKGTCSGNACGG